jgi:hypothetical protein
MITIISFLAFTSILAIIANATARTKKSAPLTSTKLPMKTFTLETVPVTLTKLTKKQAALLAKQ